MNIGITLGLNCAFAVAIIGWLFARDDKNSFFNFGDMLRDFLRTALAIGSAIVIAIYFVIVVCIGSAAAYHNFIAWLVSYTLGIGLYFGLRYGIFNSR